MKIKTFRTSCTKSRISQKAQLKPYIDRNTKLRTEVKNDFEKDFLKLKNNIVFGKTIENVKNHRDIKLVTNKRRTYLVLEPDYHTINGTQKIYQQQK